MRNWKSALIGGVVWFVVTGVVDVVGVGGSTFSVGVVLCVVGVVRVFLLGVVV